MAQATKKKLFNAAEQGYLDDLKAALEAGAPIDARNEDGRAALHLAAAAGHAHLVRELLKNGAKTERRREEDERSALHVAAEEGCAEVVLELLSAGADVSAEDVDSNTPLHCAAHFGDVTIIQALLEAGAKVSTRNMSGQTPLLVAAEASGCCWMGRSGSDYPAAVAALLRAAAGVTAVPSTGSGGGVPTGPGGRDGGGGVCPPGCPPGSETDSSGETATHAAVRAGSVQVVAALVAAGASVATAGPRGVTPLHMAAASGQVEIVRHLAAAGTPLEAREREGGLTPLHVAVQSRQLEAVEALVALGADVSAPDSRGLTPLHSAAQSGQSSAALVQVLLKGAAAERAVRTPAAAGSTLAAFETSARAAAGHGEAGVTVLVTPHAGGLDDNSDRGGSSDRSAREGAAIPTPFMASCVNASENAQRVTPLHLAAAAAAAEPSAATAELQAAEGEGVARAAEVAQVVSALLAAGADGNAKDVSGCTPLHVAAARGNVAAVLALLAAPGVVDPTRRDARGRTARQLAASAGHHAVLELLPPDLQ